MKRFRLRSLPTPATAATTASRVDATAVESELGQFFVDLMERGARDEESPDYELLEGAIDGTLDPIASELFDSRLAGDPVLQREFEAMAAIRQQLRTSSATVGRASRASGRNAARRWLGFAAAAIVLAAAGLGLRQEFRPGKGFASAGAASHPSPEPTRGELLFTDSFEDGSTEHWSN